MAQKRTWLVLLRGERSQNEVVEQLSERGVKCTRGQYSLVELGLRRPSPDLAQALAALFGVTMEHIYFGPDGQVATESA